MAEVTESTATASPSRVDALSLELAKNVTNIGRIKALCVDDDGFVSVPSELRGQVWQRLLGVKKKTLSPMARWDGSLDRPDQDVIHAASLETFDHPKTQGETVTKDIEKLITFYCKSRNVNFVGGLNKIIAPFFAVELPSIDDVYNCFYATLSKFLPNVFAEEPLALQALFQLFRLLLLYQDPVLCRHLDQYLVRPDLFARQWLFSMFSQTITNLGVVLELWDFIFVEGDPFLSSFVAVALLMKHRSSLTNLVAMPDLTARLSELTIGTVEELRELCVEAKKLRETTPRSFRKQMYNVLFRPKQLDPAFYASVHMAFCLSVSPSEVLQKPDEDGVHLIVLDCRSRSEFESGRVPTATHVDPDLVLDSTAMNRFIASFAALGQGGRTHLCYLGTGDDTKDVFMNKIILECLEQGYAHVSAVHRGYFGCHECLAAPFDGLVDHNSAECLVCSPLEDRPPPTLTRKEKLKLMGGKLKASWNRKKDEMKTKYSEMKEKRKQGQDARRRASSAASDQPVVVADTLVGKVEANGTDTPVDVDISGPIAKNTCINVSQWSTDTAITLLPCRKVSKHGNIHPRYLVISKEYVTSLEVHRTQIGLAYVKSHQHITELQRITFKKPNPNMLFFKFKGPTSAGGAGTFKVQCYLLQQPKLVTDILKARMAEYYESAAAPVAGDAGATPVETPSGN